MGDHKKALAVFDRKKKDKDVQEPAYGPPYFNERMDAIFKGRIDRNLFEIPSANPEHFFQYTVSLCLVYGSTSK
jgi:hypothetical protein